MPSGHLARQLRFVLPGAAITYWLRTPSLLAQIWSDADATPLARFVFVSFSAANNFRDPRSLCRPLVGASALSGLLTVALFLYILLIPVIKGIPPNVRPAMSLRPCRCVMLPGSRWRLRLTLFLLAFFSIGRGESPVNFRPSFRCVVSSDVVQRPPCLPSRPHTLAPPLSFSLLFHSGLRLTKEGTRVGLDGIDHFWLGVALWRARTVFGYGVHTRHHRWYVVLSSLHPIPPFLSPPPRFSYSSCIAEGLPVSSFLSYSRRIRIICARVWDYWAAPSSKSRSLVMCISGGNMCAVGVSAFFESSSSIVAISRVCIYEIVRRSQLDSPWPLVYS